MKFNVNKQSKFVFKPAPKGIYPAVCESVEQKTSKSGNEMLEWTFLLSTGDEFEGRKIKAWTVLPDPENEAVTEKQNEYRQGTLNQFLFGFSEVLGINIPDSSNMPSDEELENMEDEDAVEIDFDLIQGTYCQLNVDVVKSWNGDGTFQNSALGTLPLE